VVAVGFALGVCTAFVVLARAAAVLPSHEMDALVIGLAFFVVPCLAVYPVGAPLWAACLFGAWSLGDTARARRHRATGASVPDRLPEEWRLREG
jgi:hypothetical protein